MYDVSFCGLISALSNELYIICSSCNTFRFLDKLIDSTHLLLLHDIKEHALRVQLQAEQRAQEESERLRQQEREQLAGKRKRDLVIPVPSLSELICKTNSSGHGIVLVEYERCYLKVTEGRCLAMLFLCFCRMTLVYSPYDGRPCICRSCRSLFPITLFGLGYAF